MDSKYIVELQGKEFVKYEGLLDMAHQKGLKSIQTQLVEAPSESNGNRCIMYANVSCTVDGEPNSYSGYGDADPSNVNKMVSRHIIRMAETRAKARALRDMTNIGMTAYEEIDTTDDAVKTQYTPPKAKEPTAGLDEIQVLLSVANQKNLTQEQLEKGLGKYFKGKSKIEQLNSKEVSTLIDKINAMEDKKDEA